MRVVNNIPTENCLENVFFAQLGRNKTQQSQQDGNISKYSPSD